MKTLTTAKLVRVALVTDTIKDTSGTSLVTLAAGDIILVASVVDQSPPVVAQQSTVTYRNPVYPVWPRSVRAADSAVMLWRAGAGAVAILNSIFAQIASAVLQAMTWTPPVVTIQPVSNATFVDGTGNHATFVASFGSELLPITFVWHESDNGTFLSAGGHDSVVATVVGASGSVSSGIYAAVSDATGLISTLTITPTAITQNGYKYRCIAQDSASSPGSIATNAVTLSYTQHA
jgi:hypothetical protein